MLEETVCGVADLHENELKEVEVQGRKILLVKHLDHVFAIGSKCSHYGLPLSKGVVYKGTIRCPYHGACFSLKSGDIEDFPGIDRIPCYKVKVEGEVVKIAIQKIDDGEDEEDGGNKSLCSTSAQDTVLVVGGGIAAFEFVHTLKKNGFSGKIILLTDEDLEPYDRTKLSKAMSSKADDILLKRADYYSSHGVRVLKSVKITKVDVKNKVILSADQKFQYDKLFLGTGSRPRLPAGTPGSRMGNVFTVRTYHDTNKIFETSKGKHVVILGTSFIGMEVAASLKPKAASVSLIGKSAVPFQNVLGRKIGEAIKRLFESKGIVFYTNLSVREFRGKEGLVTHAVLSDGQVLPADVCVLGLGSEPNSSLVDPADIRLNKSGHIVVNERMETSAKDVYAGGDVVSFPLNGEIVSTGHWQMAQSQGRVAALALLGQNVKLQTVPYFWSGFFAKNLRFAGHVKSPDNILIDGDLDQFKLVAYYFANGHVSAVAAYGRDEVPALFASVTKFGERLTEEDVRSDPSAWIRKHQQKWVQPAAASHSSCCVD